MPDRKCVFRLAAFNDNFYILASCISEQIPHYITNSFKMPFFNNIEISDVRLLDDSQRISEFRKLVESINLMKEESYDCTKLNVWSYRSSKDVRQNLNIKFGNMCNGFPFEIATGVSVFNSECAYIAGAYANGDDKSKEIQKAIFEERNGMKCKRIYRNRKDIVCHMRDDFFEYNVLWMSYILWVKSVRNKDFGNLLKSIPLDAHIVENTSKHKGKTSIFWGAKNQELMNARAIAEEKVKKNGVFKTKAALEHSQMLTSNSINNIGRFEGVNCMGKIIKLMSISLIYGQEPPIDYEMLKSKQLYMLGRSIAF
jgi:hypothetical protein